MSSSSSGKENKALQSLRQQKQSPDLSAKQHHTVQSEANRRGFMCRTRGQADTKHYWHHALQMLHTALVSHTLQFLTANMFCFGGLSHTHTHTHRSDSALTHCSSATGTGGLTTGHQSDHPVYNTTSGFIILFDLFSGHLFDYSGWCNHCYLCTCFALLSVAHLSFCCWTRLILRTILFVCAYSILFLSYHMVLQLEPKFPSGIFCIYLFGLSVAPIHKVPIFDSIPYRFI